ncbi:NAD-dependent epimerase/dehydratase family protein [Winogradskyella eckloniae]|uniref:NAD-dependent epimerase/dehydratase family protein n=1 Tax=Winogradskyella eckloniae TaxID=1089306 RepID=UPI0015673880|nr:NAD-dependent epimerase/dehydratase family protein [Winogradskyella eckloniae]NRD19150.1 NAD-dependent epimerase/dehydratase family protein [Winogradskyella eckloniae]
MILVTGGTGLVGSHLLFQLLQSNASVRAIYRTEKTLSKVKQVFSYYTDTAEIMFNKIEWIKADINDIPQLQSAFKDITHVYHCAAFVSFEPSDYKLLRKINIKGTANIVNLCISFNVEKLCYVSSIATIGHHANPELLINEKTEWNADYDNSIYAITKYGAELEVWRATQEGLNAVIVNPGIILGPGYWHSKGSSSLFHRIHKGLPYYTLGITGFIDVIDVVKSMLLLMNSNTKNENFIVVSENLSYKSFFTKTANALDVNPPKKEAKSWLINIVWRLDWLKSMVLRQPRRLTKLTAKSILSVKKYDNTKFKTLFDFQFIPMDTTIKNIGKMYLRDLKS